MFKKKKRMSDLCNASHRDGDTMPGVDLIALYVKSQSIQRYPEKETLNLAGVFRLFKGNASHANDVAQTSGLWPSNAEAEITKTILLRGPCFFVT